MNILLISSQDYIHHPVPSRHHYIFERLAERHNIHVAHFHVSNNKQRQTKLTVEESTLIPSKNLLLHYTLNSPYHLYKFNKIIKENKIDIIVAAHVLAGTAAIHAGKINKIPVLFDLKDWFPDSAAAYFKNQTLKSIVHDSVLAITKYNLSHSDKISTVSPNLVKKLNLLGYNPQLITNGVDTSLFKPMDNQLIRQSEGIKNNETVIGFAGSIERWYDIKSLLQLPLYIDNVKILIVGGSLFTDYKTELESLVKSYNLSDKVIFKGLQPYERLPYFINCMDICAIPLNPTHWKDIALPNKFFEYTACGKPIISTNIPNIIDFKSPNVYIYNNLQELVQTIQNIINKKPTYNIDFTKNDWNYKALEIEKLLMDMI